MAGWINLGRRNPAILHVGRGCHEGKSVKEPLFFPPRRAIGYGTGPNGPRVPSVFSFVFTFCTTTTIVDFTSTIRQGPVHDLVNFRDLLRGKGHGNKATQVDLVRTEVP